MHPQFTHRPTSSHTVPVPSLLANTDSTTTNPPHRPHPGALPCAWLYDHGTHSQSYVDDDEPSLSSGNSQATFMCPQPLVAERKRI
jgi:hypothetical protein